MIRVAISTLGCKVNQYESAGILEMLDKSMYVSVPFNTKADCYIINTCTVTGRTDYQSRNLIRRAIRTNPEACIIVTGCYAQVAPHDLAKIPGVTLIVGNAEKEHIPRLIERLGKRSATVTRERHMQSQGIFRPQAPQSSPDTRGHFSRSRMAATVSAATVSFLMQEVPAGVFHKWMF